MSQNHVDHYDVTFISKAFDKAWLEGIMYAIYNNGLKDKHWKVVNNLNTDLKAKIKTKYGPTRT